MRPPCRSASTTSSSDEQGGKLNGRSCNGSGSPPSHESEKKSSKKPINFDLSSIEIGQWKLVPQREGALLGKCFFAKKLLVWEFLPISNQKKVRMVIKWTKIIAAKASNLEDGRVLLEIELNEKPAFDEEKSVNSKHSSFQPRDDFTDGNASKYRRQRIELAPHIFWRHYNKLTEDDDTPFGNTIGNPFQYHPSSTFETKPELTAIVSSHETAPRFNFPLNHLEQTEATGSWTQVPIVPQIEPTANAPTSSAVHWSMPWSNHVPRPQETAVSGTWTQGPVLPQQIRPDPQTIIQRPHVVHETAARFNHPLHPQQTEVSSSACTQGPVLPQQVRPDRQTITSPPSVVHEPTPRFDLPFYTQRTTASSSWTQGPVLPQQVEPDPPTISLTLNVVNEPTPRFELPFNTKQTKASTTWTRGPVHETTPWFNLPSHPQQTESSGSWTQGTSVPQQVTPQFEFPPPQQFRYQTLPSSVSTFPPELYCLPCNTNSFSLGFEDPSPVENNAPYSSTMTHQDPSSSNYNFPIMFTGLDLVEPDP